ncbi:MAG: DUF2808 domain-containing protein [Nostoc sp. LLA-1]|nr:DUF2808 domain-containing protein [Cyanocohniella sp. LLY]
MKSIINWCKTLFIGTGLCLLSVPATYAVASTQPLRLLSATTTYNQTSAWGATYYLTLTLPASATESVSQIALSQIQGLDTVRFNSQASFALRKTGDRTESAQKSGITLTNSKSQPRTIIVNFEQPLAPGETIKLGLKPVRNPIYDGVYQFQVQTASTSQQINNRVIGTARLHFYNGVNNEE